MIEFLINVIPAKAEIRYMCMAYMTKKRGKSYKVSNLINS